MAPKDRKSGKPGGWKQRLLKAQRADGNGEPLRSEFAMGELHDWAFGDLSAPQLRRKMKNESVDLLSLLLGQIAQAIYPPNI